MGKTSGMITVVLVATGLALASVAAASGEDTRPALPAAVDSGVLDQQRARQNTVIDWEVGQIGKITETALLHDNQVIGGNSGDNLLGAGVLDNARGISTIIQNSGHNVIIQESMILNIHVAP